MKKIFCPSDASCGRLTLLIVFMIACFRGSAQDFPGYGKVTAQELAIKECAFDKEASAMILVDEAVSTYNDQYNLITERHIRIKILKEEGLQYGNVSIPFYREDDIEFVSNIEGIVVNTDGANRQVIQNLEKKAIYTKNVSARVGEITIAFPSIRAGSIIDYKYRTTLKHYGYLRDWYFQREIPVALSKYVLYMVPSAEFTYQVRKSEMYPIKVDLQQKEGRVFFEMQNVAGLDDEPYMDAREDYIQRVVFQLSGYSSRGSDKIKTMTTWDAVTRELMNSPELGSQINKDLSGTEDFISLVKTNSSPGTRMKLVLNYVRKHMSWTGYNSKFSVDGVKSAWNKKKGNSGDINLILINLLKSAGLEVYPMLVSERYHGKVSTEYPFIDQFNTVYAAVFIDGKKYYLDATDPLTPPHIIPYNILNTTAFIMNKKAGGIVRISDESLQYRDFFSIVTNIDSEKITGEALLNSVDYARIRRLERYLRDTAKYVEQNFRIKPAVVIDSFNVLNQDNDSLALQHKFKFALPLEGTGDYKFVPLNTFSGFEQNPFLSEKRFSEINFGFKRYIGYNSIMNIGDGYTVDAVPKSIQLTNPDQSVLFVREVISDPQNNRVVCRIKMDFRKSHYTVEEYADIKEFYKKMFDLLNEQIVLKKKS